MIPTETSSLDEQLAAANVVIDTIGGKCPVQAIGTISGTEFYFRARGNQYKLHLGKFGDVCKAGTWGDTDIDAGYMPIDEVKRIILAYVTDEILHKIRRCV